MKKGFHVLEVDITKKDTDLMSLTQMIHFFTRHILNDHHYASLNTKLLSHQRVTSILKPPIWKVKVQLTHYSNQMGSGNLAQVARTLIVRQDQIGLKLWILRAIENNLVSSTWRVSSELSISQSSIVHHLHGKSIRSCQIVFHFLIHSYIMNLNKLKKNI